MDSEGKYHSRIYFLCPICRKAPRTLPGHLRTVCMQGRTEEDIQATVLQAKKEMAEFSHNRRFWEYHRILEIFGAANPLVSLLEEMDKKGLVVRNIPPILHTPASFTHSSTRDAEREPPAVEPEEPEPTSEEYYQSNGKRAGMSKKRNAGDRLLGHTPETAKKHYNLRARADANEDP